MAMLSSGECLLPHFAEGTVVSGFGRGSKELGIPTANFPDEVIRMLPRQFECGVYYGWAKINSDEHVYKMVMCVGWNPYYHNTVKTMETHIIHKFDRDFYGDHLKIVILGFIRPMCNYASLDDLITAINCDIAIATKELAEPEKYQYRKHQFFSLPPSSLPYRPTPVSALQTNDDATETAAVGEVMVENRDFPCPCQGSAVDLATEQLPGGVHTSVSGTADMNSPSHAVVKSPVSSEQNSTAGGKSSALADQHTPAGAKTPVFVDQHTPAGVRISIFADQHTSASPKTPQNTTAGENTPAFPRTPQNTTAGENTPEDVKAPAANDITSSDKYNMRCAPIHSENYEYNTGRTTCPFCQGCHGNAHRQITAKVVSHGCEPGWMSNGEMHEEAQNTVPDTPKVHVNGQTAEANTNNSNICRL